MSTPLRRALQTVFSCVLFAACAPDPVTTTAPPPPPPGPDLVVRTLEIVAPTGTIKVGTTGTFAFVARNAAGNMLSGATVTWLSSDATIATVTAGGVMTGVRAGTVTLVAVAGSITADISVTISLTAQINITNINRIQSFTPGQTSPFSAVAVDAQGVGVPGVLMAWTSSNPSVATVSNTGLVLAVGPGTASIVVSGGGAQASTMITVLDIYIVLAPVVDQVTRVASYSATLAPGQTYLLRASVQTRQGSPVDRQPTLTWRSDHPEVATVTAGGLVTAMANGTANIRVSAPAAADAGFTIQVQPATGVATIRLINAVGEVGMVSFNATAGQLASLAFGEARELTEPSGMIQMTLASEPTSFRFTSVVQNFDGSLTANQHYTFIAGGSGLDFPILIAVTDLHPTIPAGQALVRIVMASDYPNYNSNAIELYLLDTGAPIPQSSPVSNDFELGAVQPSARTAGAFDIVLADAPSSASATSQEAARFTVNPTPGRATTYVITGTTRATLQIMKFEDP